MKPNQIICIDALKGLKQLPDNYITLVCTSPPYANIRKSYQGPSAFEFVNWFLPIGKELFRVLKDDGSLVINICDKVVDKERIPYAFDLVLKLREIGFKYMDCIVWVKKNGVKNSGNRRANYFEYIFHLSKTLNPIFNEDAIRTPYAESSVKRAKKPIKKNVSNKESREKSETQYKQWILHPNGAVPKNVLFFPKDSGKSGHPASFHIDLPTHFIKAHSNEGDIVLDPFGGKGTTAQASKLLNRKFISFDIKQEYIDLAKELYGLC